MRTRGLGLMVGLVLLLAGCGNDAPATPDTTVAAVTGVTTTVAAPVAQPPSLAAVVGTYANDSQVVRLFADGTWEEDFGGKPNAFGGTFSISANGLVLEERGGRSDTAVWSGNELRLPGVVLVRQR